MMMESEHVWMIAAFIKYQNTIRFDKGPNHHSCKQVRVSRTKGCAGCAIDVNNMREYNGLSLFCMEMPDDIIYDHHQSIMIDM